MQNQVKDILGFPIEVGDWIVIGVNGYPKTAAYLVFRRVTRISEHNIWVEGHKMDLQVRFSIQHRSFYRIGGPEWEPIYYGQ